MEHIPMLPSRQLRSTTSLLLQLLIEVKSFPASASGSWVWKHSQGAKKELWTIPELVRDGFVVAGKTCGSIIWIWLIYCSRKTYPILDKERWIFVTLVRPTSQNGVKVINVKWRRGGDAWGSGNGHQLGRILGEELGPQTRMAPHHFCWSFLGRRTNDKGPGFRGEILSTIPNALIWLIYYFRNTWLILNKKSGS